MLSVPMFQRQMSQHRTREPRDVPTGTVERMEDAPHNQEKEDECASRHKCFHQLRSLTKNAMYRLTSAIASASRIFGKAVCAISLTPRSSSTILSTRSAM